MLGFYVAIFFLGTSLGSFLNVVELRMHTDKKWWKGRSQCFYCRAIIRWYDSVPCVSFIILRGKCRSCHKKILVQYPLVELWMGAVSVVFLKIHGVSFELIRDVVVIWVLTFIFLYDLKYGEVADYMIFVSAGLLFVFSGIMGWHSWGSMIIGIVAGAGLFFAQYCISDGRWIGAGDVSIGAFMGVTLGWPLILLGLFFAYIFGGIIAVMLLITQQKNRKDRIAFGTFLSVATIVVMLWGNTMLNQWISSFV